MTPQARLNQILNGLMHDTSANQSILSCRQDEICVLPSRQIYICDGALKQPFTLMWNDTNSIRWGGGVTVWVVDSQRNVIAEPCRKTSTNTACTYYIRITPTLNKEWAQACESPTFLPRSVSTFMSAGKRWLKTPIGSPNNRQSTFCDSWRALPSWVIASDEQCWLYGWTPQKDLWIFMSNT